MNTEQIKEMANLLECSTGVIAAMIVKEAVRNGPGRTAQEITIHCCVEAEKLLRSTIDAAVSIGIIHKNPDGKLYMNSPPI